MKTGRRNIIIDTKYNSCFGKSENGEIIRKENGTVHDTISAIEYVVDNYSHQASKIAQKLKGISKLQTAKNIYNFCFSYFQYRPDKKNTDEVRTPNRAWSDRYKGIDCDCFVALISCILKNYGWKHYIRMSANFEKGKYNHVYIILDDNGKEICIDPIIHTFNKEAEYLEKLDRPMQISVLNGLGNPYENQKRRPLPEFDRISVVDWIIKYELRKHANIRIAIATYARNNKLQVVEVEKTFATLLYQANQSLWKSIATSDVARTQSKRNYTIRNRDVLAYIAIKNSALSLAVSLLHDADILEYWLENTLNLPLATQIVHLIAEFSQNEKEIRNIIPFEKMRSYAQKEEASYPICTNHGSKTKEVIYKENPLANVLQISIVTGTAPKGKLIRNVRRMYKPSGSRKSNKLHYKLRQAYDVNKIVSHRINRTNRPLNGIFSAIGTIAGSIFGAGGAGAAIGGAIDNVFGGKKKSSNKPKYDSKQVYVWPDGNPYNRKTEDETSPSYLSRLNTLKKKPYALQVINKYNEIKAQKKGINLTQTEYNQFIAPFVQEAERQIAEKRRIEQEQRAEKARIKRETLAGEKRNKNLMYIGGGTVGALALGYGVYYLTKKKKAE